MYSQDMGIEEPEFVNLVGQIEKLEKDLSSHPLNKVRATCHILYDIIFTFEGRAENHIFLSCWQFLF